MCGEGESWRHLVPELSKIIMGPAYFTAGGILNLTQACFGAESSD